ncbi:MAG: hypothetical protein R8G01_21700 [Ilumatobacteraceae bacterium]|nr:hypothetical protein [Ilumatobacteraceae bacterium]
MRRPAIATLAAAVLALGTIAGEAGAAGTGDPEPEELTQLEIAAIFLIEGWDGLLPPESESLFEPVGAAPVDGDPNQMCGAVAQSFRFDGAAADADTFSLEALGDGIDVISPGDPSFFQFQQTFTLVIACFRTSPLLTDASISEVSLGYLLFGQEPLTDSQYPGEPHLGMNTVVSSASIKGTDAPEDQLLSGASFVSNGAFAPAATNPIPTSQFWLSAGYFQAWLLPGIPEEIRVNSADAGALTLDALSNQQVAVTPSPELVDLEDPGIRAAAGERLSAVRQSLTEANPTADDPEDVVDGEPPQDPEPDSEQPVVIAAPDDEAAVVSTTTTASTTTAASTTTVALTTVAPTTTATEGSGEQAGGGRWKWLAILLGASAFAVLVAFLTRMRRRRSRPSGTDEDEDGGVGDPVPEQPAPPMPPDGPVVEEGTAPPLVPGTPPPPHVQCDWEFWFGAAQLKQVAPGHQVCCVYRMEIDTTRTIAEQNEMIAGSTTGRIRIPGSVFDGSGLGCTAEAMTRSVPEDGGSEEIAAPGAPVADVVAAVLPDGVPPDVAAHIACEEDTRVSVTLASRCHDHGHQYLGSAETIIDLSAGGRCSNTDPGDDCAVSLAAASSGDAGISGDLDLSVGGDIGLHGDRNQARPAHGSDPHRHETDGKPVVEVVDSSTIGSAIAAGFAWSATFASSFEVDAAQIVPPVVRPTTDEVETRAAGTTRHALALQAMTIARGCAGTACGCGATECTCDPSFDLRVDAQQQELVIDGRRWVLSRPAAGAGRWTAR